MENKNYNVANDYEEEIDLIQLGLYILQKWRVWFIVALIGAILLGGYKGIATWRDNQESSSEFEYAIDDYNKALEENFDAYESFYKQWNFHNSRLDNLQRQLLEQTEYIQGSKLMHLDPMKQLRRHVIYYVKLDTTLLEMGSDSWDPADSIGGIYVNTVYSQMDMKQLSEISGVEDEYVKELIQIEYDMVTNLLGINIIGEDEKVISDMMEIVQNSIENIERDAMNAVGKHELICTSDVVETIQNEALYNRISSYNTSIDTLNESIAAEEKIIASLKLPEQNDNYIATKSENPIKSAIKFALIGFVGCLFVVVVYYGLLYILKGVFHSRTDLESRYGISLLGSCKKNAKQNGKLDQCIRSLDKDDIDNGQAIIVEMIDYHAKQNQMKNILLVADVQNANLEVVKQNYLADMQEKGYVSSVVDDAFNSRDALVQLEECDGLVLFVERGFTKTRNCDELLKVVGHYGKPVIGYVTF